MLGLPSYSYYDDVCKFASLLLLGLISHGNKQMRSNISIPMSQFDPVFILAGQSNMVGRCEGDDMIPSPLPDQAVQFCWMNDCNFGPATTSAGSWGPLRCQYSPFSERTCFGPEMGIAETLRINNGGTVQFIKFAMGSTNLHSNWNPENTMQEGKPAETGYYQTFIEYCKTSLAELNHQDDDDTSGSELGPSCRRHKRLAGMFWLQGESDSSKAKDANAYGSNFESLIRAIRRDLKVETHPVVVSPVYWKGEKVKVVNQALHDATSRISHCQCFFLLLYSDLPFPSRAQII